jgi:membrane protein implicated in regulation of membrane protease activity
MVFMLLSAVLGWAGAAHGHSGGMGAGGHDVGAGGHDIGASGHDAGTVGHDVHAGGHDGDATSDHGHSTISDLPLFSPMTIAAYITGFGGSGLIYHHLLGDRPFLHVPAAAVTGAAMGVGVSFMAYKLISRFESGKPAHESEAYGQDAEVTVAIPVDGFGEVAYVASGIRRAIPARAEPGVGHAAGERVRVVRITGGTAHVRAVFSFDPASSGQLGDRHS